jgi:DNA replication and repair protein RecF
LKKLGSQGQQKTYLIALKLAQFEFIYRISGIRPILLLDDIFDKLDRTRVEQIVRMVSGELFGQIFITDTNREHLDSILQSVTEDYRIFMVSNGQIETVR